MKQNMDCLQRGLALLLMAVMLIGLLAGCGGESSYEPLTDEKKSEIEEAWSSVNPRWPIIWHDEETGLGDTYYYGTHGDCVVLFFPGQLTMIETIDVAGCKFVYTSSFVIYVYREGEFLKLEEAYDAGWLTKRQIASIAEFHRTRLENRT